MHFNAYNLAKVVPNLAHTTQFRPKYKLLPETDGYKVILFNVF